MALIGEPITISATALLISARRRRMLTN